MDARPPEKRLRVVPFSVHATRGLVRDQRMRRKMMAFFIAIALVLAVAGLTILRSTLEPHEHPWRFILYWIVCGWHIVLVVLLALFDILLVRAHDRAARKAIRQELTKDAVGEPARPGDQ